MHRFLTLLLFASLIVIAVSGFIEEQKDNNVAEMSLTESISEVFADSKERRMNGKQLKNKKKSKKGKKSKKEKKRGLSKSCGRVADAQCLGNLVESMDFEGGVVTNFLAQKARASNWKKLVSNKKGKKEAFANTLASMLEALGGNADTPVCSMTAARLTIRSAADAIANYNILKNCSVTIEAQCAVANGTVDNMALATCETELKAIKTKNADCCDAADKDKCACFAEAMDLVTAAKNGTCKQLAIDANKAMKERKLACLGGFKECKKAEDASTGFINICLGGTDPNAAAVTARY